MMAFDEDDEFMLLFFLLFTEAFIESDSIPKTDSTSLCSTLT